MCIYRVIPFRYGESEKREHTSIRLPDARRYTVAHVIIASRDRVFSSELSLAISVLACPLFFFFFKYNFFIYFFFFLFLHTTRTYSNTRVSSQTRSRVFFSDTVTSTKIHTRSRLIGTIQYARMYFSEYTKVLIGPDIKILRVSLLGFYRRDGG